MGKDKQSKLPRWITVFELIEKWNRNLLDIEYYICDFNLIFYSSVGPGGLDKPEDVFIRSFLRNGHYVFNSKDIEQFESAHPELLAEEATKPYIKEDETTDNKINIFRQESPSSWTITYEGKTLRSLKNIGFKEINYLVRHKRKQFHTDKLSEETDKIRISEGKGLNETYSHYSDDESKAENTSINFRDRIDDKFKKELKEKWFDLKKETKEAEKNNDFARKDKLEGEMEELKKHMTKYIGRGGQPRQDRFDSERTKDRICKRIQRALDELREHDENTYLHFCNALKPINSFHQSYRPDRDISWLTE